jgi:hypothetical protein
MNTIIIKGFQQKPSPPFLILILLLTFNCLDLCEAKTANPKKDSVFEITFTGTGPTQTRPFSVKDGWEIRWETESPTFKLSAHGSSQRPYVGQKNEREEVLRWFETMHAMVLADTTDSNGTAMHPLGGTFYFKIIASGPWRIHLKTIIDRKDYLDVPNTGAP